MSSPSPTHVRSCDAVEWDDYGECWACGGSGYIADTCTCGDDTCCCLYPEEEECDECR